MFNDSKGIALIAAGALLLVVPASARLGPLLPDNARASVSLGFQHACGLDAQGNALCWGPNSEGELGDGTDSTRGAPVRVAGNQTFASIAAGHLYTCALTEEGRAYCWGSNTAGTLGDGTRETKRTPTTVAGALAFALENGLTVNEQLGYNTSASAALICET